ncbi:hypothetical protein P261_02686 [Lachnospiraceae bacterium TWA4]|nr:hypothetical protein P261_02686 [Lachnospiraceae bacterium TWA4]
MIFAGRYDGAASTLICTIRAFLFLFQDQVKSNKIFWRCVIAQVVVGVVAWQSPLSLLIIVAPVVLCSVNWFGSVKSIKYGTIFSDGCWVIFDISNGIYIEATRDFAEALSNIIGLVRERKTKTVDIGKVLD